VTAGAGQLGNKHRPVHDGRRRSVWLMPRKTAVKRAIEDLQRKKADYTITLRNWRRARSCS